MLTQEQNDLLTQTGPGAPCGELMRRYWQPVALAEELPPAGPPLKVRVLGEDLVLFRDDRNRIGLLGLHCAHRGTDLSLGRIEDGGLRCVYHGWLYDIHGRCLEQPAEPAGSEFKQKVRQKSYPCQETGGLIFAYLGPGEPPLLPAYESLLASPEHRYVTKTFHDCNYLQANEGNIDPVHLSFLHRRANRIPHPEVKGSEGLQPLILMGRDVSPKIEVEETDFGVRIFTVRKAGDNRVYLRITNFILPNLSAIAGPTGGDGYNIHWHVPIDDARHWRYDIVYRQGRPLTDMDWQKIRAEERDKTKDHRWVRSRANHWLQDRESMKTWNFSGLGDINNAQDTAAVESAGPVQERDQEHLGTGDKAIIAARRAILQAIDAVRADREPPHVIRDPSKNCFSHLVVIAEVISEEVDWKNYWRSVMPTNGKPAGG